MTASMLKILLSFTMTLVFGMRVGLAQQPADEASIRRYSEDAERAMKEKNSVAAEAALEKLARLTPNSPEVHANLGFAYFYDGNYDKATKAFKRTLQLDPAMPEAKL